MNKWDDVVVNSEGLEDLLERIHYLSSSRRVECAAGLAAATARSIADGDADFNTVLDKLADLRSQAPFVFEVAAERVKEYYFSGDE